jgi:hypothetical protein
MIGRRSFLSVLGLGSVAATLDAPQAVPANGVSLGSQMIGPYPPDVQQWPNKTYSIADHLKDLQQELSYYDDKEKFMHDRILTWMDDFGSIAIDRIDPDIRCMKSFSDSTKVRMHVRKLAEKEWEKQRGRILQRIANLLEERKNG